jgi:hypothetical protein
LVEQKKFQGFMERASVMDMGGQGNFSRTQPRSPKRIYACLLNGIPERYGFWQKVRASEI